MNENQHFRHPLYVKIMNLNNLSNNQLHYEEMFLFSNQVWACVFVFCHRFYHTSFSLWHITMIEKFRYDNKICRNIHYDSKQHFDFDRKYI